MDDLTIEVELLNEKEIDLLRFKQNDTELGDINLNSNDQTNLRNLYKKTISLSLENNIKLNLHIQEGYTKGLFKEIATEFVTDLEKEIEKIKEDILLNGIDVKENES